MSKGQDTRKAILEQALDLSSEVGLEGLSFGVLAKLSKMSKSGLYAHFESKEKLQCEVLDVAAERFIDFVISPALKSARGLPRLESLFQRWLRWESECLTGGCLFVNAATEFDDRAGPVKDRLVGHLRDMLGAVARAASIAVDEGHLKEELDTQQFAYEYWGIILSFQHYQRLLGDSDAPKKARLSFQSLIQRNT